jgi:predicted DNA-binding transcriptional regulator YafY
VKNVLYCRYSKWRGNQLSHLERIYWIDSAIRAKQYPSLHRIGEQFGIAKRTVHTDIKYLRERLNAPLGFHARYKGYFYTESTYQIPRLLLTETEVESVRRALLAAREYGGIAEDAQMLASMAERIGDVFMKTLPHISMESGVHLAPDSRVSASLLDDLQAAIRLRQRVRLLYHGNHRDEATERVICPWHLMNHESEWYVTGFCEMRGSQRDFHLSRITDYLVLPDEQAYTIPPDFSGETYTKESFGVYHGAGDFVSVKIRFSPHQSRWIRERVYHHTQEIIKNTDGSVTLSMHITGTVGVKRWILGYGSDAEVLEPTSLRKEIQAEIKKLGEIYSS